MEHLLVLVMILSVGVVIPDTTSATDVNHAGDEKQIPGGYSPADVNDPKVKEIAAFATVALSSSQNAGKLKLTRIIKAETQVVAGTNYRLTLRLVSSSSYPRTLICLVVVFDQPWTNTRKVTESSCK